MMPGVMVIEALAQTTGILAFSSANVIPTEETRFYFVGIDKARFRKPVIPGDQLILKATVQRALRGIWKFETTALVGETEVAHAEIMVAPETGK
jgi:3-hydroxyacyl-[acyl-carrier-protein] dehydratase